MQWQQITNNFISLLKIWLKNWHQSFAFNWHQILHRKYFSIRHDIIPVFGFDVFCCCCCWIHLYIYHTTLSIYLSWWYASRLATIICLDGNINIGEKNLRPNTFIYFSFGFFPFAHAKINLKVNSFHFWLLEMRAEHLLETKNCDDVWSLWIEK